MDAVTVSHLVPKSVVVIHRIELPDLDAHKIFAMQSSLRTLCITTCVVVSISVIAVCKYVVNPAILGRNIRDEGEREARRLHRREAKRGKTDRRTIDDVSERAESEVE